MMQLSCEITYNSDSLILHHKFLKQSRCLNLASNTLPSYISPPSPALFPHLPAQAPADVAGHGSSINSSPSLVIGSLADGPHWGASLAQDRVNNYIT